MNLRRTVAFSTILLAQSLPGESDIAWLAAGDRVYGLLPPQVVAHDVQWSRWSPCGRYVLVKRHTIELNQRDLDRLLGNDPVPPHEYESLAVWDVEAGRLREVWDSRKVPGSVERNDVGWIGATGTLLFFVPGDARFGSPSTPPPTPPHFSFLESGRGGFVGGRLFRVAGGTGLVEEIAYAKPEGGIIGNTLITSDTTPYALIATQAGSTFPSQILQIVRPVGPPGDAFRGPDSVSLGRGVGGTEDMYVYGTRAVSVDARSATMLTYTFKFDPQTRSFAQLASNDEIRRTSTDLPIKLERTPLAGVKSQVTWLVPSDSSEIARALVSADADDSELSPSANAVFFSSRGAAQVRRILSAERAVYEEALEKAERVRLMSNARQIATAVHLYASDRDGLLPTQGDWERELLPYLSSRASLDGFAFTFTGSSLRGITNPGQTEFGYFAARGGRVVAFADGSARWIPDR